VCFMLTISFCFITQQEKLFLVCLSSDTAGAENTKKWRRRIHQKRTKINSCSNCRKILKFWIFYANSVFLWHFFKVEWIEHLFVGWNFNYFWLSCKDSSYEKNVGVPWYKSWKGSNRYQQRHLANWISWTSKANRIDRENRYLPRNLKNDKDSKTHIRQGTGNQIMRREYLFILSFWETSKPECFWFFQYEIVKWIVKERKCTNVDSDGLVANKGFNNHI
jgi:hypothetical protein